jgi:hypothetical protein
MRLAVSTGSTSGGVVCERLLAVRRLLVVLVIREALPAWASRLRRRWIAVLAAETGSMGVSTTVDKSGRVGYRGVDASAEGIGVGRPASALRKNLNLRALLEGGGRWWRSSTGLSGSICRSEVGVEARLVARIGLRERVEQDMCGLIRSVLS